MCGFVTKWRHGCHKVPPKCSKGVFGDAYRICEGLCRQRQWGGFFHTNAWFLVHLEFFWYIFGVFFLYKLGGFLVHLRGVFG